MIFDGLRHDAPWMACNAWNLGWMKPQKLWIVIESEAVLFSSHEAIILYSVDTFFFSNQFFNYILGKKDRIFFQYLNIILDI